MKFNLKKFLGFNLIELMISIITIGCITAAFAPVITKKMNGGMSGYAGGGSNKELTTNCEKFSNQCKLCYPDKCVMCTRSCTENQYLSIEKCECINCSDISSGCLTCEDGECLNCASGTGMTSDKKCQACSSIITGCLSCSLG